MKTRERQRLRKRDAAFRRNKSIMLVYEYYPYVAPVIFLSSLLVLLIGQYRTTDTERFKKISLSLFVFIMLSNLGEITEITNPYVYHWFDCLGGVLIILTAWSLAVMTARYIDSKYVRALYVPCILITFIYVFNVLHHNLGLNLISAWIR
ncbi:hypothetical protein PVT67_04055 [Gallaecimonas kandeliae]|uniref:hypothetical protein n=1 Tax=Gallaecimonas kandeliae TaxID=3029055 RepID=UPI0026480F92|nr:hypothetical protein [Gallaecimonas kandeliae]WKE66435.1 hypothetical protein PVT67_04055 [Gallaecimonas kandeliae]